MIPFFLQDQVWFATLSAMVLIVIPVGENTKNANTPLVRHAVQVVALQMELMDKRELAWMLVKEKEFEEDLTRLHERFVELAETPPDCWSNFLPPEEWLRTAMRFNRAYRHHLYTTMQIHWNKDGFRLALLETDALWSIYDAACDAKNTNYLIWARRRALDKLKTQIGEERFYRLELPTYVPLWRFTEIGD